MTIQRDFATFRLQTSVHAVAHTKHRRYTRGRLQGCRASPQTQISQRSLHPTQGSLRTAPAPQPLPPLTRTSLWKLSSFSFAAPSAASRKLEPVRGQWDGASRVEALGIPSASRRAVVHVIARRVSVRARVGSKGNLSVSAGRFRQVLVKSHSTTPTSGVQLVADGEALESRIS